MAEEHAIFAVRNVSILTHLHSRVLKPSLAFSSLKIVIIQTSTRVSLLLEVVTNDLCRAIECLQDVIVHKITAKASKLRQNGAKA